MKELSKDRPSGEERREFDRPELANPTSMCFGLLTAPRAEDHHLGIADVSPPRPDLEAIAKPVPPPPPAQPTSVWAWALLTGAGLVVLGSFLPWVTASAPFFGTVSRSGMGGGDGIITLIAGLMLPGIGVARLQGNLSKPLLVGAWIASIAAGGVGILDLVNVQNRISGLPSLVSASAGAGLWTVIIGAAVALLGAIRVAD